jgi:hypothetical protein
MAALKTLTYRSSSHPHAIISFESRVSLESLLRLVSNFTHAGGGTRGDTEFDLVNQLHYHHAKHGRGNTPEDYIMALVRLRDECWKDAVVAIADWEATGQQYFKHSSYTLILKYDVRTHGLVVKFISGSRFVRFTYPSGRILTGQC